MTDGARPSGEVERNAKQMATSLKKLNPSKIESTLADEEEAKNIIARLEDLHGHIDDVCHDLIEAEKEADCDV